MKNLILVLVLGIFLVSCNKDNPSNDGAGGSGGSSSGNQTPYYMKAVVDGEPFEADDIPSVPQILAVFGASDNSLIYGDDRAENNHNRISISLATRDSMITGTFTYPDDPIEILFFYHKFSNGGKEYISTSGTLTITENTPDYIEGTFSFTAQSRDSSSTVVVTNGEFKAKKKVY